MCSAQPDLSAGCLSGSLQVSRRSRGQIEAAQPDTAAIDSASGNLPGWPVVVAGDGPQERRTRSTVVAKARGQRPDHESSRHHPRGFPRLSRRGLVMGATSSPWPIPIRKAAICCGSGRSTIWPTCGSTASTWGGTRARRIRSCWMSRGAQAAGHRSDRRGACSIRPLSRSTASDSGKQRTGTRPIRSRRAGCMNYGGVTDAVELLMAGSASENLLSGPTVNRANPCPANLRNAAAPDLAGSRRVYRRPGRQRRDAERRRKSQRRLPPATA